MNSLSGVRSNRSEQLSQIRSNTPQQLLEKYFNVRSKHSSRSSRSKKLLSKHRSRSKLGSRSEPDFEKDIVPKGYKKGQLRQYTPEQFKLLERLMGQTKPDSYLSRLAGGDEELFNQIEAPALRKFSEFLGGEASRFSGRGIGATKSSGFQNTIQNKSSTLAQNLAAQRQGLQQQAIKDLQGIGQQLLQERPYDRFLVPPEQKTPKPSFGNHVASGFGSLLGGLGSGIGTALGGPLGGMIGGGAGNLGNKLFG